jgi:hypothetical protein
VQLVELETVPIVDPVSHRNPARHLHTTHVVPMMAMVLVVAVALVLLWHLVLLSGFVMVAVIRGWPRRVLTLPVDIVELRKRRVQ